MAAQDFSQMARLTWAMILEYLQVQVFIWAPCLVTTCYFNLFSVFAFWLSSWSFHSLELLPRKRRSNRCILRVKFMSINEKWSTMRIRNLRTNSMKVLIKIVHPLKLERRKAPLCPHNQDTDIKFLIPLWSISFVNKHSLWFYAQNLYWGPIRLHELFSKVGRCIWSSSSMRLSNY